MEKERLKNIFFKVIFYIKILIFTLISAFEGLLIWIIPSTHYIEEVNGEIFARRSDSEGGTIMLFIPIYIMLMFALTERHKKARKAYWIVTILMFVFWFGKRFFYSEYADPDPDIPFY